MAKKFDEEDLQKEMDRRAMIRGGASHLAALGMGAAAALSGSPLKSALAKFLQSLPNPADISLLNRLFEGMLGRLPKDNERSAMLDALSKAKDPWAKRLAAADVCWALCCTTDFANRGLDREAVVRSLYQLALEREPTEDELATHLEPLTQIEEEEALPDAYSLIFEQLVARDECVLI